MTPPDFEELRMLARWEGDDPEALAIAAADALVSFARDPAGLVVACRRLVAHHRRAAPVWWMTACVLATNDVAGAADACARRLERSPSLRNVVDALPFPAEKPVGVIGATTALQQSLADRPDLQVLEVGGERWDIAADELSHVLVEAEATDGSRVLLSDDAVALVDRDDLPVARWAVVRVGRYLPEPLFAALCSARGGGRDGGTPGAVSSLAAFDAVVGPEGRGTPQRALGQPLCGAPPELLRPFT